MRHNLLSRTTPRGPGVKNRMHQVAKQVRNITGNMTLTHEIRENEETYMLIIDCDIPIAQYDRGIADGLFFAAFELS